MSSTATTNHQVTKLAVTVFLQCANQYLFLHRNPDRIIDPNRLNGIGGKLLTTENFLQTAIRETAEETGLVVSEDQVSFLGLGNTTGGYQENWVMGFFKIITDTTVLPIGTSNSEGELIWLSIKEALQYPIKLVDDLYYILPLIEQNKTPFFWQTQFNDKLEVQNWQVSVGKSTKVVL